MKRLFLTTILSFFLVTPNFAQNKRFIQAITGGHSILLGSPTNATPAYNLFDTLATVVDSVLSELINRGINPYNYAGLTAAYTQAVGDGNFLIIPATYSTDSSVTYTTAPIIDFRNGRVTITPALVSSDTSGTWDDSDGDTVKIAPSALNIIEYKDGSTELTKLDSSGRFHAIAGVFGTTAPSDVLTALYVETAAGINPTIRILGVPSTGLNHTWDLFSSVSSTRDFGINLTTDAQGTRRILTFDSTASIVTVGGGVAGIDYQLNFNGETNDGSITWQEDENFFRANKFWAYPRRLDFDIIAWYAPTTMGATLTTIGTYEEVYAFSNSDTLFHKFRLHSSYSVIDSVEFFVHPQNADGDSVAFTVLFSGKAEGESWGAWNTAGADTIDLGTTQSARKRMIFVPSVGTLSASDIVRWALIRDGSITNNASGDVNVEDTYFYIR